MQTFQYKPRIILLRLGQKLNVADIIRQLSEQRPLITAQDGEAKVVVQDIKRYEENEEMLALLKILE